jgi:galactokinase
MYRRVIVPARANIIGEHTDYANGLALPFAVNQKLELLIKPRKSDFTGEETIVALWKAAGGYPADLTITSEIPIGKGMSSSAALCIAIVVGADPNQDKMVICQKAQQLEHEVLGTPCGLLDQIAIVYAKENNATKINFENLSVEHVPLPKSWIFKLVDSGIHRQLSEIDYQADIINLKSHVDEENKRVIEAINSDAANLGRLLNDSHGSLSKLGVSLPEIDALVKQLQTTNGVLGARMMGGGFGGMIIALVANEDILPNFSRAISSNSFTFEELG